MGMNIPELLSPSFAVRHGSYRVRLCSQAGRLFEILSSCLYKHQPEFCFTDIEPKQLWKLTVSLTKWNPHKYWAQVSLRISAQKHCRITHLGQDVTKHLRSFAWRLACSAEVACCLDWHLFTVAGSQISQGLGSVSSQRFFRLVRASD